MSARLLFSLIVALAAASTPKPGDPCLKRSAECPVAPCPSPPPGWQSSCEIDPNPLVIHQSGLCCEEAFCESIHCPRQCEVDGGGHFADASDQKHTYDCSRTATGKACYEKIERQQGGSSEKDCKCLVTDCTSATSKVLQPQSSDSRCVLECRDEKRTGAAICADWDDQHDFCNFYATFLCVATAPHCDAAKLQPPPTRCERKCLKSPPPLQATNNSSNSSSNSSSDVHSTTTSRPTPEDVLDRFLRCVSGCQQEEGVGGVEAR